MPYSTITASLTVPSEHTAEMSELLEEAIDQAAIRNIAASEISVEDECADPPADADE